MINKNIENININKNKLLKFENIFKKHEKTITHMYNFSKNLINNLDKCPKKGLILDLYNKYGDGIGILHDIGKLYFIDILNILDVFDLNEIIKYTNEKTYKEYKLKFTEQNGPFLFLKYKEYLLSAEKNKNYYLLRYTIEKINNDIKRLHISMGIHLLKEYNFIDAAILFYHHDFTPDIIGNIKWFTKKEQNEIINFLTYVNNL